MLCYVTLDKWKNVLDLQWYIFCLFLFFIMHAITFLGNNISLKVLYTNSINQKWHLVGTLMPFSRFSIVFKAYGKTT